MEKVEVGYFLKLIDDLRKVSKDPEAIYDIISSKEIKQKAQSLLFPIRYSGIREVTHITEYDRIIQRTDIRNWLISDDLSLSGLELKKVPQKEVLLQYD